MRNKLLRILILIILILVILSGVLFIRGNSYKKTSDIWQTNFNSSEFSKNIQKELTWKQANKYYNFKYDSIVKKLNIKKQRVKTIVNIKYDYKDSIVIKTKFNVVDLCKDKKFFTLDSGCLNISGYVTTDSLAITSKEYKDDLTLFIYEKYKWKFLVFHGKKWIEAKVYSNCTQDTMKIINNIKIIK